MSAKALRSIPEAMAWPIIEKEVGQPISAVMRSANSFMRPMIPAEMAVIMSARSSGVVWRHHPAARVSRAAATAASTSASQASGAAPITSSV
jgi:hypothetical protein